PARSRHPDLPSFPTRRSSDLVRFRHSFRSGPNVLGAVDEVFARPEAFAGLSADAVKTVHEPLADAAPGMVEIWDTTKPADKREIDRKSTRLNSSHGSISYAVF